MKNKIVFITLMGLVLLGFFNTVYADTTIHLNIETDAGSVYNEDITVTPCDSEGDGVMKETPFCALEQSGILSDWSGLWINSINGILNNDGDNGVYWMWLANLNIDNTYSDFTCHQDAPSGCSAKQYILNPNDNILFYYNTNPLSISANNLNPTVGESIIISVKELGLDGWTSVWNPAIGGKLVVDSDIFDLDGNGTYSILISDTNPITVKGQLTGFIDTPEITITPQTTPVVSGGGGNGGGSSRHAIPTEEETIKGKFDLEKAFDFIALQQNENGSFGEDIYTDWVSISIASLEKNQNIQSIIKLVKYFGENKISGALLTDFERHAMSLMSLGLNPYDINGENYIKKITDSFDGEQFGNKNEDNDDIFALIVLQNAGFLPEEKMIADSINFILSRQKEDGSWDQSVDMTGAAIGALTFFNQDERVKNSLTKAREFLKKNQKNTGGWDNVSSTAWAIEGILALNEKPEDWINGDKTPLNYLAENQNTDGGSRNEHLQSRIWETAYAITALSGKTWNQIMQKFEKPKPTHAGEETLVQTLPKVEDKSLKQIVAKKDAQKIKTINTLSLQNTATVINSLDEKDTEPTKKNWFRNFLDKIFNVF